MSLAEKVASSVLALNAAPKDVLPSTSCWNAASDMPPAFASTSFLTFSKNSSWAPTSIFFRFFASFLKVSLIAIRPSETLPGFGTPSTISVTASDIAGPKLLLTVIAALKFFCWSSVILEIA